ncbi:MFS transporter, partial [Klebsiella aerogenes]
LNERVTNATRGMVFSIYMIVSMIGLLVGQYILPFGNPATQALFMIGALIYAAALVPTGLSNAQSPRPLTEVSLDLP